MKKLLSVLLSVMMVVAVGTSFAVPALAATDVHSPSGEVIPGKDDNKDNKSPSTGAATLGLATTAALGAGAALTLLKKKDAE